MYGKAAMWLFQHLRMDLAKGSSTANVCCRGSHTVEIWDTFYRRRNS